MLADLMDAADPRWLDDARACAALGAAFGELRQFENAITFYKKARNTERADVSVSALEQLANLQGRYAEQLWRDRNLDDDEVRQHELRKQVDELFDDSEKLLQTLVAVAPTSERHSMLGGLKKRRAMAAQTDDERTAALEQMVTDYRGAYLRKVETQQSDSWYPLINVVAAQLALQWQRHGGAPDSKASERQTMVEDLAELQRLANALRQDATGFWELSFLADFELLKVLTAGTLAAQKTLNMLEEKYNRARRLGASARQFDSVVSQIRFLSAMAERSSDDTVRGDVAQRLNDIVMVLQQEP
jgi:tetratricopeptide (TPR) repeat protein